MRGTGSHDVGFEEVLVEEKYLVEIAQRPSGGLINGCSFIFLLLT